MRLTAAFAAGVLGLSVPVHAEQLLLKNGGRISGILLERSATHVVMQIGPGQVTIPLASVQRVVEGRSALAIFAERAERLASTDANGWLELGLWARDAGLDTQARACFERVLALDPQNPTAHGALGDVLLNGRWLDPDRAYQARGYVRFEGSWMLPEERDEMLRDRDMRREEQRVRAEAEARAREAEARAREAEAAARAAQAASQGMPIAYYDAYGYVIGGAPVNPYPNPPVGPACRPDRVRPTPHATRSPPRPSSLYGSKGGSERRR